jgi:signal transduction histidine kinase
MVRVESRDRGPGIPEDFRSRIFPRFAQADSTTTRHKGGTGLGLAICKRLIEMMNGRIGFDDRPDGGTTFHFELPVTAAAAAT